ncbi:hypothetical protein DPEC_G00211780 [Dallia pectoralis]|uniref:Uncharacterized protein n=1 Tax=Dallia pectoralis TaxID=75939 RepID=A0ACC2G665_DALPE|nr:hypothetical protein DPEC_G00211780 [Dallia pectoralis]
MPTADILTRTHNSSRPSSQISRRRTERLKQILREKPQTHMVLVLAPVGRGVWGGSATMIHDRVMEATSPRNSGTIVHPVMHLR